MKTVEGRKNSVLKYEWVFSNDNDDRLEKVYKLIFEELENNPGVYSFKFQNEES